MDDKKLKFTKFQTALEILAAAALIGMIVHIVLLYGAAPDTVPTHYGADGAADAEGGKGGMMVLPIMTAMMYGIFTLLEFFPSSWNVLSVHSDRWEEMYRATRTLLILVKLELIALFWYISAMALLTAPLGAFFLPVTLAVVFGTLAVYIIRVARMKKEKPARPE